MNHFDYQGLISTCPAPEANCFMFDPDAMEFMLFTGDAVKRNNFQAIAVAAAEAGKEGVPLEDATYHQITVSEKGLQISDDSIDVLSDGKADVDKREVRIARCAYVCGKFAADGCPVVTGL